MKKEKKTNFQTNIISYDYRKNKEFLILVRKTNFLYFHGKVKVFHFRCVLNTEAVVQRCSYIFLKIHKKTPVLESPFEKKRLQLY